MIAVLSGGVGVLGLAIGSFLNVVIYRVPAGLSVVRPRSACPGCGAPISARDNVPVLSWLLLRGRCRGCREPISPRYPAIELVTGAAFVVVAAVFVPGILRAMTAVDAAAAAIRLALLLYLAAVSVALAAIDLDVQRLPNAIVLPGYAVAAAAVLAVALLGGRPQTLAVAAIGAAGSLLFYGLIWLVSPNGMGFGDVRLSGVLGLVLGGFGWAQLAVGVAGAFLIGGVVGVVLMALGRAGRKSRIPFGPWMLAGAWLGIFAGEPIARAYLSLTGLG